jgi:NAD(P)-dependent dehydrogenase (short-subunit alcohol dehydrogenase family)
MDLIGKTVVVLGASARGGTGWATAELARSSGAEVVVAARSFEGVRALADEIGGVAVQCDARIEAEVATLAETAAARTGAIDIAVLAAGEPIPGSIDAADDGIWEQAWSANFMAAVYFIRHMARRMGEGGGISLVTTLAVGKATAGNAPYASAKAAGDALIRHAAIEYAPRGIRVNGVAAGHIDSPMSAAVKAMPEMWNLFMREVPLHRPVAPAEVGAACLWLASPGAAVTGAVLPVDNGSHLLRLPQAEELTSSPFSSDPN